MAIETYNIDASDVEVIAKDMASALSVANGDMYIAIDDIVSVNDYDNKDFDALLQNAVIVAEYLEMVAEDKDADSIFERGYEKALKNIVPIACAVFVMEDEDLADELSDREYNNSKKVAAKFEEMVEAVEDGELPKRGSRRRGRGRDEEESRGSRRGRSRRKNRRDSEDGVRVHRNRSREERDESRRGRSNKTVGDGYANPAAEKRKEEEERKREERANRRNSTRVRGNRARQCMAGEEESESPRNVAREVHNVSKLRPVVPTGQFEAVAINPKVQAVFLEQTDDGIVSVVDKLGENMESYAEHELGAVPFNSGRNGKVIPRCNFSNVPPLGDNAAIEISPVVHVNDKIEINSRGFDLSVISDMDKVVSEHPFTITPITNTFSMAMPMRVLREGILVECPTFNDWHKTLQQLARLMVDNNSPSNTVLATFITVVNKRLTSLVNELLSIAVDSQTKIGSFYEDYQSAYEWITAPQQAREYTVWSDCERAMIANAMAMKVEAWDEDTTEQYGQVTFTTSVLYVSAYGEVPHDELYFNRKNAIADINFDNVPEFYTACERLVTYRNNNHRMSQIVIGDSFDNNYLVLAGPQGSSRIRAMQL